MVTQAGTGISRGLIVQYVVPVGPLVLNELSVVLPGSRVGLATGGDVSGAVGDSCKVLRLNC